MALKGTLKDFGMADIFQLISLQQKSGILKVKKGQEEVIISFLNGSVVGADTSKRELEEKLGQLLVKKGFIAPHQLKNALNIQKKTLMRLGHILVNEEYISREQLQEALEYQVKAIAYKIFRWKDGTYFFSQEERPDYDKENFTPISAESIFMECARMSDELPIIERKIKSQDMVFKKVAEESKNLKIGSIFDEDIDFGFGEKGEGKEADKIILSSKAASIYFLVNGKLTVREIIEKSDLGEFEITKILFELLNRNLIKEQKSEKEKEKQKRLIHKTVSNLKIWAGAALLVFLSALTFLSFSSNAVSRSVQEHYSRYRNDILLAVSKSKIDKINEALKIYYLNTGKFPSKLENLILDGYLPKNDIVDPWGNPYLYVLYDDAYEIVGHNGSHLLDEKLLRINQFSRTQKVILQTPFLNFEEKSNFVVTEIP